LGRRNSILPQQLLYSSKISPFCQHVSSKGMSKGVSGNPLVFQLGQSYCDTEKFADDCWVQMMATNIASQWMMA
jgi:hypothetical protein